MTTVQGATTVDVYWVPPAMSPLDLGVTTYEVYGLDAQGEHWLMDVPALEFSASVQAGYANYGVRAIFHGTASDLARACVAVTLIPPNIENHC